MDSITGLPNRLAFEAGLGLAMGQHRAFGVLFCDIDLMKLVNEVLGDPVGDGVLERAGDALYSIPDVCLASRFSSDEFAALAFCRKSDVADIAAAAWNAMTAALTPFGSETLLSRGQARVDFMRKAAWDAEAGPRWRLARYPWASP